MHRLSAVYYLPGSGYEPARVTCKEYDQLADLLWFGISPSGSTLQLLLRRFRLAGRKALFERPHHTVIDRRRVDRVDADTTRNASTASARIIPTTACLLVI